MANDYGYENAFARILYTLAQPGDALIAISSSGKSPNICNAAAKVRELGGSIVTLSGFAPDNPLRALGNLNIWLDARDYGMVEIGHQFVLHNIADHLRLEKTEQCQALRSFHWMNGEKGARTAPGEQARRAVPGTFDLMQTGHVRQRRRGKLEGDVLMVTLTGDAYVNKGPGRPVFGEDLRAETLAALACVDFVAINYEQAAINAIARLRPHVYVKGSEYRAAMDDVTGNIEREKQAVESCGGEIFYTDEITFSSSSLLNEHFGVFPPETKDYLQTFRKSYGYNDVIGMVKGLAQLKVLVVGDAIIDQYHNIKTLGQVGKGLMLAVKYESEEQFAGGSIAVANR